MVAVLALLSVIAFLCGGAIFSAAKSAIHEIEAFLLFIISALFFVGAAIVRALAATNGPREETLADKMPRDLPLE